MGDVFHEQAVVCENELEVGLWDELVVVLGVRVVEVEYAGYGLDVRSEISRLEVATVE